MAEEVLVEKRLEDGKALIRELRARNFDVSAAFWMQIDEGFWHLYLVSKLADELNGISEAYNTVLNLLRQLGESSIDSSEVTLMGTGTPAAKEVLDLQSRFQPNLYSRQRLRKLGALRTGEAHIYPPVIAP